jgi:hypothetical protein
MDGEDTPRSKVVRLPRKLDASGSPLRKEGPCYVCGEATAYRYSGYHGRYGDAWIDKWFRPEVRAVQSELLKSGLFLRQRVRDNNILRQLLKFVCRPCRDLMEDHLWPEAQERDRAAAQEWLANIEAQRNTPQPDCGVRMVTLNDRQVQIFYGDCVIGVVDVNIYNFRLRVILGDTYIGTKVPHVWTGGPAAIEIDLHRGIELMLGEARTPDDQRQE